MMTMRAMMGVVMAVLVGVACVAQADDLADAKARRKARKEQIVQLVKAGDASEGADGYLVAKAGLDTAKAALVSAENADRKIGYTAIAKANGKTVEEIGKQAAAISRARGGKK
ncbi:MAG TPA: DUF1318 domain-containing protein [Kiritimatiellia bacterium]|nr:DUF1318 domain-containing protein [Kiritimatiellia bacterium]HRU70249.1 DUF1318 domain-containing protein [Kiritimatiellia bacterium]